MNRSFWKLSWVPLTAALGCATAKIVGPPPRPVGNVTAPKRVVVEPFFEDTHWQLKTRSETRTYLPYNPAYAPVSFTRTARWQEKPLYARTDVLAFEHRLTIEDLKKLAPKWQVLTTSAVNRVDGPLTLVRVIVGEKEEISSDRTSHNVAFLFSWLVVPLFYELTPVHQTERVHGQILVYRSTSEDLRKRLIKYDTQPDYAVNTRGLPRAQESFAIDLSYEEGIFASEPPRNRALIAAFSEKLSHEIARFLASGPNYASPPPQALVPNQVGAEGTGTGTFPGSFMGPAAGLPASGTTGEVGANDDAGTTANAGSNADAGTTTDAGMITDAGTSIDGGTTTDAGTSAHAGSTADTGAKADAGATTDAGVAGGDAGTSSGAGVKHPVRHRAAPDAGTVASPRRPAADGGTPK